MMNEQNSMTNIQIVQTLKKLLSVFQSVCTGITQLFFQGFGDPNASFSRDFVLPAIPNDWILVASLSNPSIVYLRNLDALNEFEFAWNKSDTIGGRVAKTEKLILDRVVGNIYARASGATVTINISVISLNLSS